MTPKTIGHYEITGTLGEGGMGIVYAARDARLDRTVALKMIRRASTDPAAAERLRREARAAAAVSHPNICQLYDIGEEDGDLFIAMEYLEGESLAARLERGPCRSTKPCRSRSRSLAALDALHERGLIHRDLKPSNIFLTPHGVKLLDFGLARPSRSTRPRRGSRARERSSARRSTCRRNRSSDSRSTRVPTSSPPASCSTRC